MNDSAFAQTKEEILEAVKNVVLSDEDMAKASGGTIGEDTPPKFRVGDRVRNAFAPGAGAATVIRIEKDDYYPYLGWKYVVEPDNAPGTEGCGYDKNLIPA